MSAHSTSGLGRRLGVAAATVGAGALITVSGVTAASSSAATGEQATTRAGSCATNYVSDGWVGKYGQNLQTIAGSGEITEPEFSLDGRKNKRLAFVSTGTNVAGTQPGIKNVLVSTRIGQIANDGGPWLRGGTTVISAGTGGPANGDSWHPSMSGFTGKGDAAKGPSKMAFLSKATNLPGGNPTGVSAYVANAGGGGIKRLNVPETATGVGISGDSKVLYVTTDKGIFVVKGGKAKKLASGSGFNTPTTTLNGAQAAYGQNGSIYTITAKGKRKKVTEGSDPQADGGFPGGGRQQGLVRAVSFHRGGTAYKFGIIASRSAKGLKAVGRTATSTSINGGGSATAFGNGPNACLIVQVLDSGKTGGYDVPQGQCPAGQGDVTDVGVSTRYNYLAFSCSRGGLYLYHVGGK
ncbi:hypothetical protein [Patulibacter sp.]|uniref:hypothetical protein n=1 Tax=Patulibacter sp. TaxID=1912859 RepID=UPI002717453C|nr:hypothetical protein [Patulibacter sp.]MDO9407578.1 hypothetical protein [Patulibacter sp.]